jgi:O-antigen/teichoic acid export membrane protein
MERKSPVDLSPVRVISDSFFYSAARIAVLILKPFKGVLLGRLLGPRLYGILNIPNPYVLIASMLSNIGFNTSVLKLMPGYLHEGRADLARMIYRSSAFLTVMLSSIWAAVLLALSPWIAAHFAHEPAALNPIRLYALAIPFLAVNTFFASAYLAVQRGKLGAAITFVYGLLNTLLPVGAVLWQRNVTLVIGAILAAEVIAAVIFTAAFHRSVLGKLGAAAGPLVRGMRETVSFGFLFFIAGLGWNLINSVDRIMIKYYLPSEQLGFYSMGAQVVTILNVVASTLGFALVPSLTAARDSGDERSFGKLVDNASRFGFIVLMPIAMIVFVLANDIFELLLPRFGPSIAIVQIVAAVTFIELFNRVGWASLVAHGRGGLSAAAYVAAAAMNIGLNIVLIPRYGIKGAAVAVLVTFAALACILLTMAARVARVRIRPAAWLHPFALTLCFVPLGWLIRGWNPIVGISFVGLAGSALYGLLALVTRLVTAEDLVAVRAMLTPRATVPHVRFALWMVAVAERIVGFLESRRGR